MQYDKFTIITIVIVLILILFLNYFLDILIPDLLYPFSELLRFIIFFILVSIVLLTYVANILGYLPGLLSAKLVIDKPKRINVDKEEVI